MSEKSEANFVDNPEAATSQENLSSSPVSSAVDTLKQHIGAVLHTLSEQEANEVFVWFNKEVLALFHKDSSALKEVQDIIALKRLNCFREEFRTMNDLFALYLIWRDAKEKKDDQRNQALQERVKQLLGLDIKTDVGFISHHPRENDSYLKSYWYDNDKTRKETQICRVTPDGLTRLADKKATSRKHLGVKSK